MSDVHYIDQNADHAAAQLESNKSQVQNIANEDQLLTFITQLENYMAIGNRGDQSVGVTHWVNLFYKNEEKSSDGFPLDFDPAALVGKHNRMRTTIAEVLNRAKALSVDANEHEDINGNTFTVSFRINRLLNIERWFFETARNVARQYEIRTFPTMVSDDPCAASPETSTDEELSPFQNLLLELLNEIYDRKYRRYKGQCCSQIKTPSGHNTRAWKPEMSISDFVYDACQKDFNRNMWLNLTAKSGNARDSAKYLNDCKDTQFPQIEKNRHVWSFNNGIFIGKDWNSEEKRYISKFYAYESKDYLTLPANIVAAKYFDKEFESQEHIEDWWDIPTPHFQSIMDYQRFPDEVCRWMYVMGGKLCYDVGDIDSWQIIPFLKGIARSGKSTLITKVFKKFYESEDVRTLSNNIERKFGLSSIYDGFMFIAPEVKGDLCLEQAEFQSLVSGEDVSVARKYENAKSVEWKTPGILGGNEIPNWKDNSGSVLRRILPWNFSKQVMEADPHLDQKLDQELPVILQKCVRGYLDYAQKYSDQDIWNVVPPYFKTIQNQVAMVTNSLQNFLASEKIRFGPELFCPQKIFVQNFNQHCQENNLGKPKFNPDFYAGPFSSRGIEVRTEAKTYKGRAFPAQPMVFGVDVIEETLQFGDDY